MQEYLMNTARYIFFYMMKPLIKLYFMMQYNFSIQSNPLRGVRGPYLVIGHHVKNDDPLFVLSVSRQLIRYLAADANMDTPWKRSLFNAMGMIPFRKKRSDMKSIRQLMAVVKAKEAVGLYPEGGRNWDGATDTISPSTAKLIKMLGIDVYITFYKGGYLTKPRWADYARRGRILFDGYKLFDSENLKAMKADEILTVMKEALTYNEYDWQRKHMVPFKGHNKAMGITRLLFKCPACNAEHQLTAHGDDFHCSNCQQNYHINQYGFIEGVEGFDDTVKWHRWQKNFIPQIASEMTSLVLDDITYETRQSKTNERKIYPHSTVRITKGGMEIMYDGHTAICPIAHTYGFSFTLTDIFEFFTTDCKHRLLFDHPRHLANVFIIDLMNHLKENTK